LPGLSVEGGPAALIIVAFPGLEVPGYLLSGPRICWSLLLSQAIADRKND
jgi:hypothetical protein